MVPALLVRKQETTATCDNQEIAYAIDYFRKYLNSYSIHMNKLIVQVFNLLWHK